MDEKCQRSRDDRKYLLESKLVPSMFGSHSISPSLSCAGDLGDPTCPNHCQLHKVRFFYDNESKELFQPRCLALGPSLRSTPKGPKTGDIYGECDIWYLQLLELRFPPSLRPSAHFSSLKNNRELYGRTVQCRTGHGYTGEFRRDFKLDGPYSEPTETREHILRDCPRYNAHRHHLTKVSPQISLPTILGTKDGISALTNFLKTSGAFTRPGIITPEPSLENEPEPPPDNETPSDSED
jgi:hypothetical protein